VKVRSRTFESESDVLIIDTNAARESRRKQRLPSPANCILTVEGKYYLIPLPREEALQYLGVRSNFPSTMASLFVTNSFSPKANQCLAQKAAALPYEFGVMPATRFQAYVRAHIRAALRRHVLRFDFGHRM
jgi:hypothetical protein